MKSGGVVGGKSSLRLRPRGPRRNPFRGMKGCRLAKGRRRGWEGGGGGGVEGSRLLALGLSERGR